MGAETDRVYELAGRADDGDAELAEAQVDEAGHVRGQEIPDGGDEEDNRHIGVAQAVIIP